MPIYEYQCTACQHQFDLMQKMSDPATKICPECSQETAVRLVSAASFQLKGTGWYATDFKDKGKPKPAAESGTSHTTDSKPAPAPATKTSETKGGDK